MVIGSRMLDGLGALFMVERRRSEVNVKMEVTSGLAFFGSCLRPVLLQYNCSRMLSLSLNAEGTMSGLSLYIPIEAR